MLVSATDLVSYLYCPRKLYLAKVLKIREPVKDVMVLGSVRHAAYEEMGRADEQLVHSFTPATSYADLLENFKISYSKLLRAAILKNRQQLATVGLVPGEVFVDAWKHILVEAQLRSREIFSTAAASSLYGAELWQQLEPKVVSEMRIESETHHLKGIVDQIHVFKDEYVPVELKTGRTPVEGVWPGHRIQVGVYALLVGEKFSTRVNKGLVRYLDTQQNRPVVMNPFLEMEVKEMAQKVIALLDSTEMPACSCKFRRGACEELMAQHNIPR